MITKTTMKIEICNRNVTWARYTQSVNDFYRYFEPGRLGESARVRKGNEIRAAAYSAV